MAGVGRQGAAGGACLQSENTFNMGETIVNDIQKDRSGSYAGPCKHCGSKRGVLTEKADGYTCIRCCKCKAISWGLTPAAAGKEFAGVVAERSP